MAIAPETEHITIVIINTVIARLDVIEIGNIVAANAAWYSPNAKAMLGK